MMNEIKKLKKIELHLHLDGSLSPELASKLSGLSVDTCKKKMIASDKCMDLSDYLTKFDFPISLMQAKENLELVASDLVNRLEDENVIYAEIKVAPMSHTKEGLTYEEVVESILSGLNQNKNVKTNLILCMRRGNYKIENLKTIEVAKKFLNKGVVAVDLVGDEKKYKLNNYLDLFLVLQNENIPFTIHAGEVDEKDILNAILLGCKRIGHGIKCINDPKLLNLIKSKNILLEVCPTSNIQTNAFNKYKEHPIYNLYKNNINISINTDNKTVSNISLNEEYLYLLNNFGFKIEDLYEINKNAVNYTFLTSKEQIDLINKLDE